MVRSSMALALIGILVMLAGCGPHRAVGQKGVPLEQSESVVFVDFGEKFLLRVVRVGSQETATGRVQVMAQVRNLMDREIECDVKCKFRDAAEFVVDETNWQPCVFGRREIKQLEFKSLSTKAVKDKFVVMIRYTK